jgi:ABC-type dipeptide/oligopeptide/nickel transport system permease component
LNSPSGLLWALLRHLGSFVLTLIGCALLLQLLLALAPGDAADLVANDPMLRAALVEQWRLDQPVWRRTLQSLAGLLTGQFGESLTFRPGTPVSELLLRGAASSGPLLLGALLLSLGLGAGMAWLKWERGARLMSVLSIAPVFLIAATAITTLNQLTFAGVQAGWWSAPAWFALPVNDHPLKTALAITALAIGSSAFSEIHQASHESLRAIRSTAYVDAAIARGAPLSALVLRNFLLPLSAITARRAAIFVGGLVVVEKVLHVQGAGAMLWQACRLRDWPLVVGLSLLAAFVVAGTRLLADMSRLALDPRLRGQA